MPCRTCRRKSTSSGFCRSISTRIIRSASSARAIRARVPVNDRPPRASTVTTAVLTKLGEDYIAVRHQDDHAHFVSALDREQAAAVRPRLAERIKAPT